jgi:hypothetical protein
MRSCWPPPWSGSRSPGSPTANRERPICTRPTPGSRYRLGVHAGRDAVVVSAVPAGGARWAGLMSPRRVRGARAAMLAPHRGTRRWRWRWQRLQPGLQPSPTGMEISPDGPCRCGAGRVARPSRTRSRPGVAEAVAAQLVDDRGGPIGGIAELPPAVDGHAAGGHVAGRAIVVRGRRTARGRTPRRLHTRPAADPGPPAWGRLARSGRPGTLPCHAASRSGRAGGKQQRDQEPERQPHTGIKGRKSPDITTSHLR